MLQLKLSQQRNMIIVHQESLTAIHIKITIIHIKITAVQQIMHPKPILQLT